MPSCGWSYRPYVWIVEYMLFHKKSPCLSGWHHNCSCLIHFNTMGVSKIGNASNTSPFPESQLSASLRSNAFWWIWDHFFCFASGDVLLWNIRILTIRGICYICWELACWPFIYGESGREPRSYGNPYQNEEPVGGIRIEFPSKNDNISYLTIMNNHQGPKLRYLHI